MDGWARSGSQQLVVGAELDNCDPLIGPLQSAPEGPDRRLKQDHLVAARHRQYLAVGTLVHPRGSARLREEEAAIPLPGQQLLRTPIVHGVGPASRVPRGNRTVRWLFAWFLEEG